MYSRSSSFETFIKMVLSPKFQFKMWDIPVSIFWGHLPLKTAFIWGIFKFGLVKFQSTVRSHQWLLIYYTFYVLRSSRLAGWLAGWPAIWPIIMPPRSPSCKLRLTRISEWMKFQDGPNVAICLHKLNASWETIGPSGLSVLHGFKCPLSMAVFSLSLSLLPGYFSHKGFVLRSCTMQFLSGKGR